MSDGRTQTVLHLRFNWTRAKRAAKAEKRPVIICGFEIRPHYTDVTGKRIDPRKIG